MKSLWFFIVFCLSPLGYVFQTLAFDANQDRTNTLISDTALPLIPDEEEAIIIFRAIFKIQERWAKIPTVTAKFLPGLSLWVINDPQEQEHQLHVFNAETTAFLETLSINGRVVAINEQGKDLTVDVQGPEANERVYFRVVRNTEVLDEEQQDFVMFIAECLIFGMQHGVLQRATIMAEDMVFLNTLPDHIRRSVRGIVKVEAKPSDKVGIPNRRPNDN